VNYNPYAPPRADGPPPGAGPLANEPGGRQSWEIGEVLRAAWNIFTNNWVVLVFSLVVTGLMAVLPFVGLIAYVFVNHLRPDGVEMQGGTLVIMLFMLVTFSFFQVGLVRIWVAAARGQSPDFGLLFSGGSRYLSMLGVRAIVQAPTLLGAAMVFGAKLAESPMAVPAATAVNYLLMLAVLIFQALGLYYADFLVVDAELGAIESLKQSWAAAGGERGKIFLFALACVAIIIAASMCCGFPAIVAYPVVVVAAAIVYLRITGRGVRPAADAVAAL
jgi:uncharacterized membrane protein